MNAKRYLLVLLGFAVSLLLLPGTSDADDLPGYCCVCTACAASTSRQCISVEAPGFEETDCASRCATENCQFLEVLDGSCNFHAADCAPFPAPATSRPVLFVLGILVAGGGIYLTRRRVTR